MKFLITLWAVFSLISCSHTNQTSHRKPSSTVAVGHVYYTDCDVNYMGTNRGNDHEFNINYNNDGSREYSNDLSREYSTELARRIATQTRSSLLGFEYGTCSVFLDGQVANGRNLLVFLSNPVTTQETRFSRCIPYTEYHGTPMGNDTNDLSRTFVREQAILLANNSRIILFEQIGCEGATDNDSGRAVKVVVRR